MDAYEYSIVDLFPYAIMASLLILFMYVKGTPKRKALYGFIVLFLFAAIRYGIGYDYFSYVAHVKHQVQDYSYDRIEPLSLALIEVGHFTHYQVFFIIGSLLTLFPVYLACAKLSRNPAFSMAIYFLHPLFYLDGLGIVRNAIAFSLVFYSMALLLKGKKVESFIWIVCAILFHKSAAIAFLIYAVYYMKNERFFHLALYIASFFLSFAVAIFVREYAGVLSLLASAERYIDIKTTSGGGTMTLVLNLIAILNIIWWNRIARRGGRYKYLLGVYNVGICIWNIFLRIDFTLASRLSTFFIQSLIILVPTYSIAVRRKYSRLVRQLSLGFFIVLYLSYFYINITGYQRDPSNRMSTIPYQTIFYHKDYSNYQL